MMSRGVVMGIIIGGLVALFTMPKQVKQAGDSMTVITHRAKEKIQDVTFTDPIEESLAVGKAAARRRREELGLDSNTP